MFGGLNPQAASFLKPAGMPGGNSPAGGNNWFTNPMNFFAANSAPATASLAAAAQFSPFSGIVPDPALIASKLDAVNASMNSNLQHQHQQSQQNLFNSQNSGMMNNTNTSAASVITSIASAQNAASLLPAFYGNLMAGQTMYNPSSMNGGSGNNTSANQILQGSNMQNPGNRLQNTGSINGMQQQQQQSNMPTGMQTQQAANHNANVAMTCNQSSMSNANKLGANNGLGQVPDNMNSVLNIQNSAAANAPQNTQLKNPLSYILAPVQSNP